MESVPWNTWLNPSNPKDYSVKPVEPPKPVPLPPTDSINPPSQKPGASSAFRDGLADRTAWEEWFSTLTGDYRDGADYWAGQRSSPNPGSCYDQGYTRREFVDGCMEAKRGLTLTDLRRKSEPEYKEGWNSYPAGVDAIPPAKSASQPTTLWSQQRAEGEQCAARGGTMDGATCVFQGDTYSQQCVVRGGTIEGATCVLRERSQ
jgi:hypothetical protein